MGRTRAAEMTSEYADSFSAQMRQFTLGPVSLLGTSFPSIRVKRTERMIRRSDEELFHVTVLTAGRGVAVAPRSGRTEAFKVGDIHLAHSSYPYDTRCFGVRGPASEQPRVEGLALDLPASLLPIPGHRLLDLLGRKLSGRAGTGALLTDFVLGAGRQAAVLDPAEASRLGMVVVDLIAAWLARELDAENTVSPEGRQRALLESVRLFVRHNLHDPELAPPVIAAAHHISLSYLHRLFAEHAHGETVAAFIRRQRLARAHRDLADPALMHVPIYAIAARCGMLGASEFTRAFKTAYGLPPREHRNHALASRAGSQ
ncbi:AraC family transcriptional regulator [Kitasatospora phosalacinea]